MKYILIMILSIILSPHITNAADTDFTQQIRAITECSDSIDNDGDGLLDFASDPDCLSWEDTSESPEIRPISQSQSEIISKPKPKSVTSLGNIDNIESQEDISVNTIFPPQPITIPQEQYINPCELLYNPFPTDILQAFLIQSKINLFATNTINPCLSGEEEYIGVYREDIGIWIGIISTGGFIILLNLWFARGGLS